MKYVVAILIVFSQLDFIHACTIFSAIDSNGQTWAGNNEDYFAFTFQNYIKVFSRTEHTLGYIALTYENGFIQGGINEEGLFFDGNFLSFDEERFELTSMKNKLPIDGDILRDILARCKSVPEVLELLAPYNTSVIDGQLHLADKYGNLGMVLPDTAWVTIKKHSISTNFHLVRETAERCWRFPIAQSILEKEEPNLDIFTRIADSTSQKNFTHTIYSNVHNLSTGDIWFYYALEYKTAYKTSVSELLAYGDTTILIRDLFPENPLVKAYNAYRANNFFMALDFLEGVNDPKLKSIYLHIFKWELIDNEFFGNFFSRFYRNVNSISYRVIFLAIWLLLVLISLTSGIYTLVRLRQTPASKRLKSWFHLWPFITSLFFIGVLFFFIFQPGTVRFALISFIVLVMLFISLCIWTIFFSVKNHTVKVNRFTYWSSIVLSVTHMTVCCYFFWFNSISQWLDSFS